ncbi:DUF2577 family protein [Peptostreptococcus equinus]|uniref:DUF2577 family protein n=1 Tax=Peptostreptococcus equinus TaxID=3003601 RepID=A0ABY7JQ33_9FIRM|nr:DUF2577 family protein [Peptostreptococcus sp. CBA3647]WAW15460.1 DUF2577 family protein [Peptostreptococcus sp. CBA3647]
MANLLQLIKKASAETFYSMAPCDNIIGTVVSVKPLRIKITEKITLEKVNLLKLKSDYILNSTVVLSRCQGGDKYVILGELIE